MAQDVTETTTPKAPARPKLPPKLGANGKAAKDLTLEDVDPATVQAAPEHLPKPEGTLRIASVNVNGIRAAWRKGMPYWLENRGVDILALQEVRAPDAILREFFGPEWHIHHAEASDKGRAGVALLSRAELEPTDLRTGIGEEYFASSGRWVEADFQICGERLSVVSAYVHSGEADTPKQADKYRFLDGMIERLPALAAGADHALVLGDLNVGHTERDIKNWRANRKKAGFLPEERAYFDRFFGEIGYRDVVRGLAGDVDGPYTWWSQRGQAFENNTGWRIDYHMASPALAEKAARFSVDRGARWDTRFTDHAPLVVDYQF